MQLDILDFLEKLISKCIPVKISRLSKATIDGLSFTAHSDFSSMINYHLLQCVNKYFKHCKTSTITHIITPFHTQFYALCLSKEADEHLIIGPFLETPMEDNILYSIINNLHLTLDHGVQLKLYYQSTPIIDSDTVLEILYTINEYITKNTTSPSIYTLDLSMVEKIDSSYHLFTEDVNRHAVYKIIETRYAEEDKMMAYIRSGDVTLAQSHWKNSVLNFHAHTVTRLKDSLRNQKNLLFVANTLFRKAAQAGGVHPVYIDELSSKWAIKIEQSNSLEVLNNFPLQMIRAYCLLTKNHSLAQYSPIVRKALTFIHLNLSTHLTVKKIAYEVSVSKMERVQEEQVEPIIGVNEQEVM